MYPQVFYSCNWDASGCEHHSAKPYSCLLKPISHCCGMCQRTPLRHIACSEDGWLLQLAVSLKLFLVLDKPRLHVGKAAAPIPSFLHLLQALGLWHLHPQLGSCGVLRTTAATGCFSQAMCFMFFISNLTSSNQTTFSPELAEVLVGYQ